MEYVDRAARILRSWLVRSSVRQMMPWVILVAMLAGSLIKELAPLPETYMSNKRNVLNVYFVKFAWAWTLCLLLPFISVTSYCVTRSVPAVLRRLSSLLVGTAIWYVCTGIFLQIEDITGSCYKSPALDGLLQGHSTKLQCQQSGGFWHGFDISGHAFLLSYCTLMILEEMAVMHNMTASLDARLHKLINGLFLALSCLTLIWLWLFLSTAIYFHDFSQKLFGTLLGLLAWYGTYRFWYLTPLSPGLPPQSTNLSSQKFKRRL